MAVSVQQTYQANFIFALNGGFQQTLPALVSYCPVLPTLSGSPHNVVSVSSSIEVIVPINAFDDYL